MPNKRMAAICLLLVLAFSQALQADIKGSVTFQGTEHGYTLHLPPTYVYGTPRPLIVSLHGAGWVVENYMSVDNLSATADTAGFLLVYPQGYTKTWNSGPMCCGGNTQDDVGFMRALIDTLSAHYSINRDKIYATGCSNGGMMSNRLAAQASDVFAAICGVAGPLALSLTNVELTHPLRPVSILDFHALDDKTVPYYGDPGWFPAETSSMAKWALANECDLGPTTTTFDNQTTVTTWKKTNSPVEVILYTTQDGGHWWPPSHVTPNHTIWNFFNRHSLQEVGVTPFFNKASGAYTDSVPVKIKAADGVSIYFTIDGSTPTKSSTLYTGAVAIKSSGTLKARGYLNNDSSAVISATYTVATSFVVVLVDSITREPIKTQATAELSKSGVVVDSKSGVEGFFRFPSSDSGSNYTLKVTAAGYHPATANGIVIKGAETSTLVFQFSRLPLTSIDLQPKNPSLVFNFQKQLDLFGIYSDGTIMPVKTTVPVVWTSRLPNLVSVDNSGMLISGTLEGDCFVTAQVPLLGFIDSTKITVTGAYGTPSFYWKLDESAGAIAMDDGGSGNSAALHGGPVWSTGKFGNALTFDGVDDYVSTSTSQVNPQVFSLSLWFKTSMTGKGIMMAFANKQTGDSSTDYDRSISINNGIVTFMVWPGHTKAVSSPTTLNDNLWHHVTGTISGTGMQLYIDGRQVASDTNTKAETGTRWWRIGNGSLADYFSGSLDDIRIYDVGLSPADAALLAGVDAGLNHDRFESGALTDPMVTITPNPCNPDVCIGIRNCGSKAVLKIYDVRGKMAMDLTPQLKTDARNNGIRRISWNASGHASGVYFVFLKTGSVELKRKLMLIR